MPRLSHWSELNPMLTSSSSRQASTLLASCFLLRTISFPKYVGTYNRAYRRGILLLRRVVLLLCLLCLPSFRCFGSFRFYTSVVGSLLSRALSSSLFSLSLSLVDAAAAPTSVGLLLAPTVRMHVVVVVHTAAFKLAEGEV